MRSKLCTLALGLLYCTVAGVIPERARAQDAESRTTLVTLGTQGGPRHTRTRSQPATAIIVNGQPYLIDAGNGVGRQLVLAGISPLQIRQIFITHHHDDHNADLGTLMGLVWSIGIMPRPITVYGPVGTGAFIAGFEQMFAVNERIRRADFPAVYKIAPHDFILYNEIGAAPQPKLVYKDQNVQVDAVENCHFHTSKAADTYGNTASYAYRFKTADKIIVISGDTGPCEALVEFARGADILLHEVINVDLLSTAMTASGQMSPQAIRDQMRHMAEDHTSPEDVGELAARAGVRMVVLTHVIPGNESDPSTAYSDGVSRHFTGKVVLAADLARY